MTDTVPAAEPDDSGGFMRIVYIAAGSFFGVIIVVFGIAVWASAAFADGQFGQVVAVIRDIMFIFLVLEGMLIVLALVILIAQVARLVNVAQNEIKPILHNTQETVKHAKGTVEFIGKNVAEPVINANRFVAAAGVFTRELFRMKRVLRKPNQPEGQSKDGD
jgi:hypothetical protein